MMNRKLSYLSLLSAVTYSYRHLAHIAPSILSMRQGPSFRVVRMYSSSSAVSESSEISKRVLAFYGKEERSGAPPLSPDHERAVLITRQWVKDWVIRHRLCPWAASVYSETAMRVKVIDCDTSTEEGQEEMIYHILAECTKLADSLHNNTAHKTSLLILPSLQDFDDYLDIHSIVEDMLPSEEDFEQENEASNLNNSDYDAQSDEANENLKIPLDEKLQIATFHPKYVFQESESATSVENYTNRAPFPILHLLSVRDVSIALDSFEGDTDDIWKRNVELMKSMGRTAIRAELKEIVRRGLLAAEEKRKR